MLAEGFESWTGRQGAGVDERLYELLPAHDSEGADVLGFSLVVLTETRSGGGSNKGSFVPLPLATCPCRWWPCLSTSLVSVARNKEWSSSPGDYCLGLKKKAPRASAVEHFRLGGPSGQRSGGERAQSMAGGRESWVQASAPPPPYCVPLGKP